jgi:hypothetical protein
MLSRDKQGFGMVAILLVVAVIAVAAGLGFYTYKRSHPKTSTGSAGASSKAPSSTDASQTSVLASSGQSYLIVNELGIKFQLPPAIKDAYYAVKPNATKNGQPIIALYVHSLDKYKNCTQANNADGVAEIATFTPGYTDEVVGDYNTSYPDAPQIGGLRYYILTEQFDCSEDGTTSPIYSAFRAAYKDIAPAANEFAIPELGIKLTLPNGLTSPDLKYSVAMVQGSPVAYFTTESLQQADAAGHCGVSSGAIGAMSRLTEDPKAGTEAEKKIGQYYILFQHPQGLCTAKPDAEQLEGSQLGLLREAFQTTSPIN